MNAHLNWVRLPLENLENCRDLGGYASENGEQTKWHSFLRSDNMSKLNESEITFLQEYGVKTVIDLRSDDETSAYKNPLSELESFDYHNIPLAGQLISNGNMDLGKTMGDFYVTMLKESPAVEQIFNVIGEADEGGVVFHCMAGKDRTGVLAMLLLGIAGVAKKDIISNYEVTYTNLESIQEYKDIPMDIPKSYLHSDREYIIKAYDYIVETYDTFENYLIDRGIEKEVVERVKQRMVYVADQVVLP